MYDYMIKMQTLSLEWMLGNKVHERKLNNASDNNISRWYYNKQRRKDAQVKGSEFRYLKEGMTWFVALVSVPIPKLCWYSITTGWFIVPTLCTAPSDNGMPVIRQRSPIWQTTRQDEQNKMFRSLRRSEPKGRYKRA